MANRVRNGIDAGRDRTLTIIDAGGDRTLTIMVFYCGVQCRLRTYVGGTCTCTCALIDVKAAFSVLALLLRRLHALAGLGCGSWRRGGLGGRSAVARAARGAPRRRDRAGRAEGLIGCDARGDEERAGEYYLGHDLSRASERSVSGEWVAGNQRGAPARGASGRLLCVARAPSPSPRSSPAPRRVPLAAPASV